MNSLQLNSNLSDWSGVKIDAEVKLMCEYIKARLTLCRKGLSKPERHRDREDIKPNQVVRAQYYIVVPASWVVFSRCPTSKWIPVVDCILFVKRQKVKEDKKTVVEKQIERFELGTVHVAAVVHEEHQVAYCYEFGEVL